MPGTPPPAFPGPADRTSLSLSGEVPVDTAEASYGAAGNEPHATKLTKRSYPAARRGKHGLLAKLEL